MRVVDEFGRVRHVRPSAWKGGQWAAVPLPVKAAAFRGSMFWPHYWGEGTVFTRDVTNMPFAADSAAHAAWMSANVLWPGSGAAGGTSLNTSTFGTQPIATYVVDSTAPGCEWQWMDSVAAGAGYDQQSVDVMCKGRIPMPLFAVPAAGGDQSMAIYDIGTGIMREYFLVNPVVGKPGHWTAATGGWSATKPGMTALADTNPGLQLRTGSSAAVGMHNALGFIGVAEVMAGEIGHALAYTCSNMGQGMSWPATGADGTATDADAPIEGQWSRLPATVDPLHNPVTGAPYKPMTQLIIRAAQRYGMVCTDKNLYKHAFNTEDGRTYKELYGTDPWGAGGICTEKLGTLDVSDFPWHLTEWAPVDWGRPSPDFWLRRGQMSPWVA